MITKKNYKKSLKKKTKITDENMKRQYTVNIVYCLFTSKNLILSYSDSINMNKSCLVVNI